MVGLNALTELILQLIPSTILLDMKNSMDNNI